MISPLLILRLRRIGCPYPIRLVTAARKAGLSIPLGCSMVVQESSWQNIFGHDPTIYQGAGVVTESKYVAYRAERDRTGKDQGVGVTQLTYTGYQEAADKMGGCWVIANQLTEGFEVLAENVRRAGLEAGVAAYNGSGPEAAKYAAQVVARAKTFAVQLHLHAP